jgi:hypothetical protein
MDHDIPTLKVPMDYHLPFSDPCFLREMLKIGVKIFPADFQSDSLYQKSFPEVLQFSPVDEKWIIKGRIEAEVLFEATWNLSVDLNKESNATFIKHTNIPSGSFRTQLEMIVSHILDEKTAPAGLSRKNTGHRNTAAKQVFSDKQIRIVLVNTRPVPPRRNEKHVTGSSPAYSIEPSVGPVSAEGCHTHRIMIRRRDCRLFDSRHQRPEHLLGLIK